MGVCTDMCVLVTRVPPHVGMHNNGRAETHVPL